MSDQSDRETALATDRSFIVQAPAGSGKTELLIQRFLSLLTTVEEPEQIVAITFTRKAAAEMRARVCRALRDAVTQLPVKKTHEIRTRELAKIALQHSQQLGWNLIKQPQRLRINTLDSLNAWLAQRLPVLSGGVYGATVLENAESNYLEATRRVLNKLSNVSELRESLKSLLKTIDSRVDRLEKLLAELLSRREQWGAYLGTENSDQLAHTIRRSLENLVTDQLEQLARALPKACTSEIVALFQYAAENSIDTTFNKAISNWDIDSKGIPTTFDYLTCWQALANLLLTKKQKWRTRLPANLGFGKEADEAKVRLVSLIEKLKPEKELLYLLHDIRSLPSPHYEEKQWQILSDLRIVLHYLRAELRIVFAERSEIDFVELALAARSALGAADAPSELLLALDYRIQHILIDEFQDTSRMQMELLELLTAGWESHDGRTMFLVGDPMQSIYRFRNADMSLFIRTKDSGIGDISLESLTLTRNFRSAPAIIDWVNKTFPDIFPAKDDFANAAARFYGSEPVIDSSPDSSVEFHALRSDESQVEIDKVIELLIKERQYYPNDSVAVLVQSRSHLAGLQEQLRVRGVKVQAVELDPPNKHQITQDLLGLTRALTHLGDKIAWLSLLRAPWCGMTWSDLHGLVDGKNDCTVWALMNDPNRVKRLSDDGRVRLTHCRKTLKIAFECRSEQPLARWIERIWITLGGGACLSSTNDFTHVEKFFSSLRKIEKYGDLDDPSILETFFSEPHRQAEIPLESSIQIMTIHRAKGLEFDSVILFGLGRAPRSEESRGLYWLERTTRNGQQDLLIAPLTTTIDDADLLTEYLKTVEKRRENAERARLLYVATTRAKFRLNLVGRLGLDAAQPVRRSLLRLLWPGVEDYFNSTEVKKNVAARIGDIQPWLRRLPETLNLTKVSCGSEFTKKNVKSISRPTFEWAGRSALQIGTVVHTALQTFAEEKVETWTSERVRVEKIYFREELRLLGVDEQGLSEATQRVIEALCRVLTDETGRWLLDDHAEAESELRLTLQSNSGLEHVQLDRTFVDKDGTRWIIDFKTSSHEGGSTEEFLDSEVERYRSQLERYAGAMAAIDARPIKLGLYFPLLQAFRTWTPSFN